MNAQQSLENVLLGMRYFARNVGDQVRNEQQNVQDAIRRYRKQQQCQREQRHPLLKRTEQERIYEEEQRLLRQQLEIGALILEEQEAAQLKQAEEPERREQQEQQPARIEKEEQHLLEEGEPKRQQAEAAIEEIKQRLRLGNKNASGIANLRAAVSAS